jgi:hypothetical protein
MILLMSGVTAAYHKIDFDILANKIKTNKFESKK